MLWDDFSRFDRVVGRFISIPSYSVFSFVSRSNMSHGTIVGVIFIGTAVGVLSVYLFVSTFVVWII